mmetsp:Transcript_34252/g.97905  ORF Transcript_34252/g.97905 Transcript_34252/m.97905 type:complete len:269 (+) Transcript_34252:1898-2704(+)
MAHHAHLPRACLVVHDGGVRLHLPGDQQRQAMLRLPALEDARDNAWPAHLLGDLAIPELPQKTVVREPACVTPLHPGPRAALGVPAARRAAHLHAVDVLHPAQGNQSVKLDSVLHFATGALQKLGRGGIGSMSSVEVALPELGRLGHVFLGHAAAPEPGVETCSPKGERGSGQSGECHQQNRGPPPTCCETRRQRANLLTPLTSDAVRRQILVALAHIGPGPRIGGKALHVRLFDALELLQVRHASVEVGGSLNKPPVSKPPARPRKP